MKKRVLLLSVLCVLALTAVILFAHPLMMMVPLGWDAPTTNEDGTPLTDLAGYKVYVSEVSIPDKVDTHDPVLATEVADIPAGTEVANAQYTPSVETGTLYFRVTAYDTSGNESHLSNEVTKNFDFVPPGTVLNFMITP